jgi:hypothetical protein
MELIRNIQKISTHRNLSLDSMAFV